MEETSASREKERAGETIQTELSVLEGGLGLKIAAASPAVHLHCVKR